MKICSICQSCYEDAAVSCTQDDRGTLVASRPGSRKISAKYRLDILIERSVEGETYQATDLVSNKSFVIKLIDPNLLGDVLLMRERLNTELRAAVNINHPNVVKVNDYGVLGSNEFYIATDLSDGQTLRQYLKDADTLSEATAVFIARQTADGLEAAHSVGVIHRNLSPANIVIMPNEHGSPLIKVRNFDFGGIMQQIVTTNASDAEPYLEAYRYFSPEQCARQTVDARTDIYSLGTVLYEMLSGEPLFDGATIAAIVDKKNNGQPPPLNNLHFDVKALLTHTLMRSLNKSPELRPQTATSFARHLRHLEYITKQFSSFLQKPQVNPPIKKVIPNLESAAPPDAAALILAFDDSADEQKLNSSQASTPIAEAATSTSSVAPALNDNVEEDTVLVSRAVFDSEPIHVQKRHTDEITFASELIKPIPVKRKDAAAFSLAANSVLHQTQNVEVISPTREPFIAPAAESFADTQTNLAASTPLSFSDADTVIASPAQKPLITKRFSLNTSALIAILAAFAILAATFVIGRQFQQSPREQATAAAGPVSESTSDDEPASATDAARNKVAVSNPSKGAVASTTIEKQPSIVSERDNKGQPREDALTNNIKSRQNTQPSDEARTPKSVPAATETSKDSQLRAAKNGNPEAELDASLNKWIEATNSRDVNQQMNYYAPKVNSYYQARNATQETVKAEKKRIFENAAVVDIRTSKPEIVLSNDGQSAKMRFNKKYVIKKGQQNRSGEVVQELQWVKSKNGWKIVSERDVKVINR